MGMRADGRIDGLDLEWLRTGGEEIPGRLQSLIDCSRTGIADGGWVDRGHALADTRFFDLTRFDLITRREQ